MPALPLIVDIQRIIERTFDLDTGISDITPFIIGDEGYARIYANRSVGQKVVATAPAAARTLIREDDQTLKVCLYYPNRLVENLERNHPRRRLAEENVDDFATLVEELDHLLTIADRHRAGMKLSLLELELHGNVTKELTLELFVARMRRTRRLSPPDRAWVRHHLFGKVEYREADPEVQVRYRDAASLAVRYLDYLHGLPARARRVELRRFHRRSHQEKLAQITRL